jgi:class 3 adenylate cyclase
MTTLPGGTVTFLFTDIEGSTRLLQELGDAYADVVRDHRGLLREHLGAQGGTEVDTQGDAFFYSFSRARDAVAGAVGAQRALADHDWPKGAQVKVRMGLHTGEPSVGEEGYLGMDVVRAARICSAGHGSQILLSETTRALLGNDLPAGVSVVDLGQQNLKDVQHERIYQLALDDGPASFPPLKAEKPKSSSDVLAERIQRHVEEEIERSLRFDTSPQQATKHTFFGLLNLVLLAAAAVVIVLLIKLAL